VEFSIGSDEPEVNQRSIAVHAGAGLHPCLLIAARPRGLDSKSDALTRCEIESVKAEGWRCRCLHPICGINKAIGDESEHATRSTLQASGPQKCA
jgi:hypothetical protein